MSPKDIELVLHIGLHKTATTYVQNVLSGRRYDLVQHGVLYPTTGTVEEPRIRTRDGAQSGHLLLTQRKVDPELLTDLVTEIPRTTRAVLLSSEDFSHARRKVELFARRFSMFGAVRVVAVVRRQDDWIESYYKQRVDQFRAGETRSFGQFLAEDGAELLDFHTRLVPWLEYAGPDRFHVLSYDDLGGGDAICRRLLELTGVPDDVVATFPGVEVRRYESASAVGTMGVRILNLCGISSRDVRNTAAREIYAAAPDGDLDLVTEEMRSAIKERFDGINAQIEAQWLGGDAPGFRFAKPVTSRTTASLSATDLADYLDRVTAICAEARRRDAAVAS